MNRRKFLRNAAAACLCPVCASLVPSAVQAAEEHGAAPHWSYEEGHGGPQEWGKLAPEYQACSIGKEQSPIDLTKSIPATLGDPVVTWSTAMPVTVVNNGHTIQVNCPPGSTLVLDGETYELLQFHFHHPSEHTIDGKGAAMEVHFVHKAASGSLAVLGVMIESGAANPTMETIWRVMPRKAGESVALEPKISPAAMLPSDVTTFRYAGSLTTPPCSEVVSWVVYQQGITASDQQIAAFADLFPMNARPVQPLNRRKLLKDFF